jgi:hypothetical protein
MTAAKPRLAHAAMGKGGTIVPDLRKSAAVSSQTVTFPVPEICQRMKGS